MLTFEDNPIRAKDQPRGFTKGPARGVFFNQECLPAELAMAVGKSSPFTALDVILQNPLSDYQASAFLSRWKHRGWRRHLFQ